jgi:hypothetical protein
MGATTHHTESHSSYLLDLLWSSNVSLTLKLFKPSNSIKQNRPPPQHSSNTATSPRTRGSKLGECGEVGECSECKDSTPTDSKRMGPPMPWFSPESIQSESRPMEWTFTGPEGCGGNDEGRKRWPQSHTKRLQLNQLKKPKNSRVNVALW